jgi:DNA mismatch repair protein MSH6
MTIALALKKRTAPVQWGDDLSITDIYHPGIGDHRVYNSVKMTRKHLLLTGPNRGGKSTLLKSIGAAVLMSQTCGIVFARRAILPLFDSIITALQPSDVMGKMSLFEAEIEFAKSVNTRLSEATGPVFLMMDEIFHGTNAHDGVEASQVFLDSLYDNDKPVFSVISTHYMDLPTRYGEKNTQNMCMAASVDPADPEKLIYTYMLCEGVNKYSSVREILRERGLLTEKTPMSASKV